MEKKIIEKLTRSTWENLDYASIHGAFPNNCLKELID